MRTDTPPNTTTKTLWCATCGAFRGTTKRPHIGRHMAQWVRRGQVRFSSDKTCADTDTFED